MGAVPNPILLNNPDPIATSYKFLKIFSELLAFFGTIFVIISPFFLKLISTAQTDILFMFFAY